MGVHGNPVVKPALCVGAHWMGSGHVATHGSKPIQRSCGRNPEALGIEPVIPGLDVLELQFGSKLEVGHAKFSALVDEGRTSQ